MRRTIMIRHYYLGVIWIILFLGMIDFASSQTVEATYGPLTPDAVGQSENIQNSGVWTPSFSGYSGALNNTKAGLYSYYHSYRSLFQWNITNDKIPDGSIVDEVEIKFQYYLESGAVNGELGLYNTGISILNHPSASTAWNSFSDPNILDGDWGTQLSGSEYIFDKTYVPSSEPNALGTKVCNAIQNSLSQDRFTLGVRYVYDLSNNNLEDFSGTEVWLRIKFHTPIPLVPTIIGPTNGTTCLALTVSFSWQPVSNATGYIFQVSTDPTFSSFIYNQSVSTTSLSVSCPALVDAWGQQLPYYWRVNSVNGPATSDFCAASSFKTAMNPSLYPSFLSLLSSSYYLYWGETATLTVNLGTLDYWCNPTFTWQGLNITGYNYTNPGLSFTLPTNHNVPTATVTNQNAQSETDMNSISAYMTNINGTARVFLVAPNHIHIINGYRPPIINPCGSNINSLDQFIVSDANGNNQPLFVLNGGRRFDPGSNDFKPPPEPPEGVFSAHFQSGKLIETVPPTNALTTIPIVIKSVTNPLTIHWNIQPENKITYFLSTESGNEQSHVALPGSGSQVLSVSKGAPIFIIAQAINPPPCEDDPQNAGMSRQKSAGSIPGAYSLNECYPNPFNPTTKIDYALPQNTYVTLRVFNVLGQEVGRLVDEFQTAGFKSAEFNASNLPSGLYFYRLTAGSFTDSKKMMLLK
jgi:hypothetical protein